MIVEFKYKRNSVASFTDAWIETTLTILSPGKTWSHLLQMRGLKLFKDFVVATEN